MGIRNAWVTLQKKSIWHWGTLIALAALGYLTFLRAGYGGSSLSLALMWGIFLLVETAPMLWTMLIFTGAMLMVSRIFPPAGFVFLLIGIIFFVLRIRYVIQNLALSCGKRRISSILSSLWATVPSSPCLSGSSLPGRRDSSRRRCPPCRSIFCSARPTGGGMNAAVL